MIRLIIVVLLLLIFAVFSLIALPILWLIGKKNPVVKEKASDAVARFMFRLILFVCGTKTTAIGVENIPTDKPVLFVGNHQTRRYSRTFGKPHAPHVPVPPNGPPYLPSTPSGRSWS